MTASWGWQEVGGGRRRRRRERGLVYNKKPKLCCIYWLQTPDWHASGRMQASRVFGTKPVWCLETIYWYSSEGFMHAGCHISRTCT